PALELGHGPDAAPGGGGVAWERRKLRLQTGAAAFPVFVPAPHPVPERLDDVIGCDAEVRRAAVDHRQHRGEDAAHRADLAPLRVARSRHGVEMTEQFVCPVDQVNVQKASGLSISTSWRKLSVMTKRATVAFAVLLAVAVPHAQQSDRARALDAQIGRIFEAREYEVPRFGPARWLPDGMSYTTVERGSDDGRAPEIVRYDAKSGARSVLVPAAQLTPKGRT